MAVKTQSEVHPVLQLDGDETLHITQRTNGVWYYQRRIPQASQPFFNNRKTLKCSLKTTSKSEATRKARALSVNHDELFEQHYELSLSTKHNHRDSEQLSLEDKHLQQRELDKLSVTQLVQLSPLRAFTAVKLQPKPKGSQLLRD